MQGGAALPVGDARAALAEVERQQKALELLFVPHGKACGAMMWHGDSLIRDAIGDSGYYLHSSVLHFEAKKNKPSPGVDHVFAAAMALLPFSLRERWSVDDSSWKFCSAKMQSCIKDDDCAARRLMSVNDVDVEAIPPGNLQAAQTALARLDPADIADFQAAKNKWGMCALGLENCCLDDDGDMGGDGACLAHLAMWCVHVVAQARFIQDDIAEGRVALKKAQEHYQEALEREGVALFGVLDKGDRGELTESELVSRLSDFGYDDETIAKFFIVLDANKDGAVSRDKFVGKFSLFVQL